MAKNTVDVYVKLPSGRVSQFDMTAYQTITNICERVAREEKVEVQQVRLKYQGKVLKLADTITYLGIRAETILKAEILESRPLTLLLVREGAEGEEELHMRSLDTLASLRNRVADMLCCSPGKVSITVWSRELKGTTIQDAGLSDGSKINVSVRTEPEVTSKAKVDESPARVEEEDKPVDPEKLQNLISSFDAEGKRVEVAFSFDTTGSMSQYIKTVRRKLRECCTRLLQDVPNIRISLIAHGDYCDQNIYVTRCVGLTSDAQALVTFADTVENTGGGDSPECYEWVLREAQQLDWGEDSAKALVIIGDAEPHYVSYTDQNLDWNTELDVLIGMGVKVYGVQPKQTYPAAHFYEALAERSGGCYLNLSDLNAITDMFLAVCYSEADGGQLEELEAELEAEGRMSEGAKQMFQKLGESKTADTAGVSSDSASPKDPSKPSVRKTLPGWGVKWWNPSHDPGTRPEYSYNANTGKWTQIQYSPRQSFSSPPVRTPATRSMKLAAASAYKQKKKGCVVM